MWNKDNDVFQIFRQYEEGYRIQRLKYNIKNNNDGDTNLNNFRNNDNDTYLKFRKYEEDQRIDKLKCIDKNNNDEDIRLINFGIKTMTHLGIHRMKFSVETNKDVYASSNNF